MTGTPLDMAWDYCCWEAGQTMAVVAAAVKDMIGMAFCWADYYSLEDKYDESWENIAVAHRTSQMTLLPLTRVQGGS